MTRILIVDDDQAVLDILKYYLETQGGYEVFCAHDGGEAMASARSRFDVIIMDIFLPDTNGIELCRMMRKWHSCPIIFSSCIDDTDTIIRALEMGGDDFITKPYDNRLLLARIQSNLRRVQMDAGEAPPPNSRCGDFLLEPQRRSLLLEGRRVRLSDMEFRILTFFTKHPYRYFAAEEIYFHIWGKDSLGDVRTVQVHIHNLRRKIEPDPSNPVYLKNEWGKGYIFSPKGEQGEV